MRTISVTDLVTKDTSTIISELVERKYSILDSLGCHRLCQEVYLPGLASRILCKMIIRRAGDRNSPQWGERVKAGIIKLFSWAAPTMIHGAPPKRSSGGVVIGFNHPSLGEILRLIEFVARYYPDMPYVFPAEEPSRLLSVGLQRVGHDLQTKQQQISAINWVLDLSGIYLI